MSSNNRSIGRWFLIFSLLCGLVGTAFSVVMRLELAHSGMQFFKTGQQYNVFVTQHAFILICFSLLPAMFFGFGQLALSEKREVSGAWSKWSAILTLALLVLAFLLFLTSAFIELDIYGRNGVGGGWTVYPPLSTSGKPVYLFGFAMDLGILSLFLVILSVLIGGLNYLSVLLFRPPLAEKKSGYSPLIWSVSLAFIGALLLMPYHGYMTFFATLAGDGNVDPVLTQLIFKIFQDDYTSLLFIIALGLASTVALSGQAQSGILVKGMIFLISLYAGLEIYSLGWGAFCQERVLRCQGPLPYLDQILWGKSLSIYVLFLLWVVIALIQKRVLSLPNLWIFSIIIFYIIGAYTGKIMKVDNAFTESTFYVAHFHFLAAMTIVFVLFAAVYFWFPHLITSWSGGVMGHLHFWAMFIGVLLCFIPQIFLGQDGMARATPDYPDMFGFWNMVSSIGSYVIAFGFVLFLLLLGLAYKGQQRSI